MLCSATQHAMASESGEKCGTDVSQVPSAYTANCGIQREADLIFDMKERRIYYQRSYQIVKIVIFTFFSFRIWYTCNFSAGSASMSQ